VVVAACSSCVIYLPDVPSHFQQIGGVLCNSVHSDGMFCVTIGVGLNVTNKEPTTCVAALLADAAAARDASRPVPVPGREELLARIASQYEELEARFVGDNSFDALRPAYLHHWLHSQQIVTLEEGVEGASRAVPVTIQGLTSSGYLLAVDEAGERYELHPDGNSLDWFAGLVRRKMKA
jgi:biotin---protein ligase